jgi:hypothetical protein
MPRRAENRLTKRSVEDAEPNSLVWDAEVPGFGVRVTARGTRSFVFQFRTRLGQQGKLTIGSFPSMTVDQAIPGLTVVVCRAALFRLAMMPLAE